MVFCNSVVCYGASHQKNVTILILVDGFLQYQEVQDTEYGIYVTILILVDGFLQ